MSEIAFAEPDPTVERIPSAGVRWHEYAELFPWIEGPAYEELKADIAEHGIREPIVFLDGAILDGRNRYMAARDLGIEYPRVEYQGDDPLGYVVSLNLKRRHLTESQRGMVAKRLESFKRGDNRHTIVEMPIGISRERAAEMLNVSPRTVARAAEVIDHGTPELIAAVDRGEIKVSAGAEIARLPKEEQPAAVEQKIVNRTSFTGNNEWYTPLDHIERARKLLGAIQLDPASSEVAQRAVKAKEFFTEEQDGLSREWAGKVWLNPPYAQPFIGQFADKMVAEYRAGRVVEAVMLTHNYTDTAWFHTLAGAASAICFTKGRIRFEAPDGALAAPTQGQAFFYFGKRPQSFLAHYRDVGIVVEVHR